MSLRTIVGFAKMLFGIAAASFGLLSPANGSTITVGLPAASSGNCIPFSCPGLVNVTSVQQVYAKTAFSGMFVISEIEFFDSDPLSSNSNLAGGTFTLSLSTTSKAVGALDSTSPSNNLGPDNQIFFNGPLGSLSAGVKVFDGTAFSYNPAAGNLLLTVTYTGASFSTPAVFLDQAAGGADTTFAAFTNLGTFSEPGLVTAFISAPEPSTLLLVTLPLSLLYLVRCRRTGDRSRKS